MSWVLSALAALVVVIIAAVVLVRRSRPPHTAQVGPPADYVPTQTDPRVKQFRLTGSNRIVEPQLSAADLRKAAQAEAEHEDIRSEIAQLEGFLQDVRDSMGADEAVFWRWSHDRDSLSPAAWSTPGEMRPVFFDMSWGGLLQWSAEQRLMNFDADARAGVTRLAAAPIVQDDRLIGVLSVSRAGGLDRGREHIKSWLPRHATQVARLVLGAELRREYGRHMRQSQALLQASKRFQGHISQDSLVKAICETAVAVSSATEAALVRWRAEDKRGWLQYATEGFKVTPHPLAPDSLVARTCEDGLTMPLEDTSRVARPQTIFFAGDDAWPKGSLTIVPLKLEERVIGAIVIASPEKEGIPSEEATNVGLLGAMAATSLEIVWEMEEVSKRARTDPLTGLYNRRHVDELLGHVMKQTDRFGDPVSMIMADVDHFKNVNDTWGHDAGDAVLVALAELFRSGVRDADIVSRFGGEEFAIVLPKTELAGAAELAEKLRKRVEGKTIMHGSQEIRVTISCGVASYPEALTKEALFAAADRALYEAKAAGRNCVKQAVPKPTGIVR